MGKKIAIIGGGNLGTSIAEGILFAKFAKPSELSITKRNPATLDNLKSKGIFIGSDNAAVVKNADVIILAVKPFQAAAVLEGIKKSLRKDQILISVVSSVMISDIEAIIEKDLEVFRAMPNTAIAIRESMTCLSIKNAKPASIKFVSELFETLGKTLVIGEELMEAATILGACGTAYALRYIRANIQGGIEIGFSAETAALIAAQTVKGAAELLLQKGTHPEYEIDKVTTPKGRTIAGLNEMEHRGFSSSLIRGIVTSFQKEVKK